MADPLTVFNSVATGFQVASVAGTTLLATIQLLRDLKEAPGRLASLLNDVDESVSRLCHSCNAGSRIFQNLDSSQMQRLSRCATTLHSTFKDLHDLITPLVGKSQGRRSPTRHIWKTVLCLKVEKGLPPKLERLNRLNLDLIRELGFLGLESSMTIHGLVSSSKTASRQALTTIEAQVDSIQSDFRHLTLSIERTQNSWVFPLIPTTASAHKDNGSSTPGSKLGPDQEFLQEAAVSQERVEQMRRYLAGTGGVGATPELNVISSAKLPGAEMEVVLLSIRTFYTPGNFETSPVIMRPQFWDDTDFGIYLMKVSQGAQRGASRSRARGNLILKKSTVDAGGTLTEAAATILIEILSTLSPVNTATCPHIRERMLQFLSELARRQLPLNHPIAIVLNKLKSDGGDKMVTLGALEFLVDRLHSTVGILHPLTQLGLYRLCGNLRRGGDFEGTERVARAGIRATKALLGPGSVQERQLSRQLEHVHMDRGDWAAALSVCFSIVGQRDVEGRNPDPLYHDACALLTMEDIAKACECGGNRDQAVAWLKQAIISHGLANNQTDALDHICDKLRELLKEMGRDDELRLWTSESGVL